MSASDRTRTAFRSLLVALTRLEPRLVAALRPGVAPDRWAVLRDRAGVDMPEDARPVWEAHDGEVEERSVGFLADWRLLGVSEIETERAFRQDLASRFAPSPPFRAEAPSRSGTWDDGWIPIAENGGGAVVVIDTNPSEHGRVGQLLLVDTPSDPFVLAPSLAEWFEHLVAEIDAGLWEANVDAVLNLVSLVRRDAEPPW